MNNNIIVIGGGVSGLTTALTLQLLGHETSIVTDKLATDTADKRSNPEFASLFPSASIIPHSVYSNRLEELFRRSQSFFYELRKRAFPGITLHKHYEIFEEPPERPAYCDWMLNLQPLDTLDKDAIPQRSSVKELHGWAFDCIFADWKLYLPALHEQYLQSGGSISRRKLSAEELPELPADTIINCSGTGAPLLFDDPSDQQLLLRGHLLHKPDAPLITNANDEIVSYNYTPKASAYADADGYACDVYCYPRKDGWVLGGSRQMGSLQAEWPSQPNHADIYEIDGIRFPQPIIDLNQEILEHTYDLSLSRSDALTPSVGCRYLRNRENGLRLESESLGSKTVIHNYGHGGAGVTLSWGCAVDIAGRLTSRDPSEAAEVLLKKIA